MKIILSFLFLMLSTSAFSNNLTLPIDDPFNYLIKGNGLFNEDYKERYHRYYNADIRSVSIEKSVNEYIMDDNTYLIFEKFEGLLFNHPKQEQCDITIISHNDFINSLNNGVDSFSLICFYKGAVISNIHFSAESLNFYGFDFSLVQINNTARLFYQPNLENKENRLMTKQIRKIILEDIDKAFKFFLNSNH